MLKDCIINVWTNSERQVGRQCPRSCSPRENLFPRIEGERNSQRRILTIFVYVVHSGFCIRQRRLATPAIRKHSKTFINQTLVMKCLKGPHDAFHIRGIEGLVVIFKINPTSLARDISLPFIGVSQHACATCIIEFVDSECGNCRMSGNAKFFLGFYFCWETVTVPAKSAINMTTAHRLVTRYSILHKACE